MVTPQSTKRGGKCCHCSSLRDTQGLCHERIISGLGGRGDVPGMSPEAKRDGAAAPNQGWGSKTGTAAPKQEWGSSSKKGLGSISKSGMGLQLQNKHGTPAPKQGWGSSSAPRRNWRALGLASCVGDCSENSKAPVLGGRGGSCLSSSRQSHPRAHGSV